MKSEARIETLTPEICAKLLEKSEDFNFRKMKQYLVDTYAALIKAGKWDLTGEPIIIDDRGHVIDGQHRLAGCVKAGVPFTTWVIRGVVESQYLNSGIPRKLKDLLEHHGYVNTTTLASIARLSIAYENGGRTVSVSTRGGGDRVDILEYIEGDPFIQHSAAAVADSDKIIPKSIAGFVHHQASKRGHQMQADYFFHALAGGEGLSNGSPILLLRNRLVLERKMTGTAVRFMFMFLAIRAWNLYITGQSISKLQFHSGQGSRESQLHEFYEGPPRVA